MLKKLFQSFRSPLRRTQHKRSTPEVLNSSQHSLQRAQFSRYAVNIVERLLYQCLPAGRNNTSPPTPAYMDSR